MYEELLLGLISKIYRIIAINNSEPDELIPWYNMIGNIFSIIKLLKIIHDDMIGFLKADDFQNWIISEESIIKKMTDIRVNGVKVLNIYNEDTVVPENLTDEIINAMPYAAFQRIADKISIVISKFINRTFGHYYTNKFSMAVLLLRRIMDRLYPCFNEVYGVSNNAENTSTYNLYTFVRELSERSGSYRAVDATRLGCLLGFAKTEIKRIIEQSRIYNRVPLSIEYNEFLEFNNMIDESIKEMLKDESKNEQEDSTQTTITKPANKSEQPAIAAASEPAKAEPANKSEQPAIAAASEPAKAEPANKSEQPAIAAASVPAPTIYFPADIDFNKILSKCGSFDGFVDMLIDMKSTSGLRFNEEQIKTIVRLSQPKYLKRSTYVTFKLANKLCNNKSKNEAAKLNIDSIKNYCDDYSKFIELLSYLQQIGLIHFNKDDTEKILDMAKDFSMSQELDRWRKIQKLKE
jgi:hypothetical protein